MRQHLRRTLSALTALALTAALAMPAAASNALGEDLTAVDTELHRETVLSTNVFWSTAYSDLRTENVIRYTPSEDVTPIVAAGEVLTDRSGLTAAAQVLQDDGYRVVAGINGDFYNVNNGLPIGIVVTEGELRSSDAGYYAIGFRADGTAVLGKPAVTVTADLGFTGDGEEILRRVTGVNKARVSTGGIYLYTYDFNANHTTGNTEAGVDVLCSVTDGRLSIGETLTLTVERVEETGAATAIQPGQVVLSANLKSDAYQVDALRSLLPGAVITVSAQSASAEWDDVEYAVGSLYALALDGAVVQGLAAGSAPRTAVGQTADGDLIFYTIDGRRPGHSIGATLSQVGERLIELGCVTALCLDGGGSTTLCATKPDQLEAKAVNRPSDGAQRSVTNQIFLVASNEPTGRLDHFYVQAEHPYVLAGSTVKISAAAIDTNYIPMEGRYTLDASDGEIRDADNVLMTPKSGGDITVTARDGRSRGQTVVHAIANPTAVAIRNSGGTILQTLRVSPGTVTQLVGSASYNHISLYAEPEAFTWEITGDIGTIDSKGTFTALNPGSGTITASAGGHTAEIQVTVSGSPLRLLEDFEDDALLFNLSDYGSVLTRTSAVETVRVGRGAGRWDYTLDLYDDTGTGYESRLSLASPETVAPHDTLNLWVCGDNSGNTLSLLYSDSTRTGLKAPLAALNFTGWKLFSVSLVNLGIREVEGLAVSCEADITLESSGGSGTIYLDHLVLSRNGLADTRVPAVTLELQETTLSGTVKDEADGVPTRDLVSVTYDGKALDFSYDESTGALSANLPAADGNFHRLTVTARDVSGNIGRASKDIDAGEDQTARFSDTKTYWGTSYCDFLYDHNIDRGYSDGTFRPDQKLTRLQFAAMLCNTLAYMGKLNPADYAAVTLPFADLGKIPEAALPSIRALYSEGIINGSMGKDGRLYFNPDNGLTRAQASAMIGRAQEKGYAMAELTFTDAKKIPDYAVYYVQTMAAQGIIGGYQDNTFKPGNGITRGQMAKILCNLL